MAECFDMRKTWPAMEALQIIETTSQGMGTDERDKKQILSAKIPRAADTSILTH